LLFFITVAEFIDHSSSFTVPQPQCVVTRSIRRRYRSSCLDFGVGRTCGDPTMIYSTAQDEEQLLASVEEQLLASVEDGTFDIDALEELEVDGSFENEYEEDEEDDTGNETELLLKYVEECRETPIGELDASDAELIREILGNVPVKAADLDENEGTEKDVKSSTMKASYTVESLLNRIVDEWRDATVALESEDSDFEENLYVSIKDRVEREKLFRPVAMDFHETIVAIWNDEQNNDSPDTKAARIWEIISLQRELISFFADDDISAAESLYPTYRSLEILLESLSTSFDRNVDQKASEIVEQWLPEYELTTTPEMYGSYIQMVARARYRGAARKAESILRRSVSEYPPNKFESPIGVETFNYVVTAYAKARGEEDGPRRAQDLIVYMDSLESLGCAPNAKTFTSLVDSYAQMNEWESVTEAQAILNNLLNQFLLQEGEGSHLEPSVATWTIVIAAWMRLSKKRRKGAAKRAGDLLRRMESLSSSGRISAKPDAIAYVTVFNAYAHSQFQDEVEEAERILDEMNEVYLDGDDSYKPTVRSIKILLNAWIKLGALDRAEQVLKTYEDVLEEAENNEAGEIRHKMSAEDWQDIYKSILIGYTRLGNARRATAYLNLMIENDDTEPDSMCYERIIDALIRLGDEDCAKHSQEIFEILEQRRQAGAVKPNERVFTGFIRALTKSKVPGLYKKADLLLQRMHKLKVEGNPDVQPTIFTYNAVLNACADSANIEDTPLQEAFQTGVRLFNQLRDEMDPDHVTFANMIRCANLLPSASDHQTKDKFVTATFRLCCESGNVNNYLIRDLSKVASKDLWKSLTGYSATSDKHVEVDIETASMMLEHLPTSWKRKASDRRKPSGNYKKNNNYR